MRRLSVGLSGILLLALAAALPAEETDPQVQEESSEKFLTLGSLGAVEAKPETPAVPPATHEQVALIECVDDAGGKLQVNSFCLSDQGQLLAGCGDGPGAVRIYSPVKKVLDQDPEGLFIRRYCPELARVPSEYLAEPHKMPSNLQHRVGCIIGKHYPLPIVEHAKAYRNARSRLYSMKGSSVARAEANRVYQKHGSRRRPTQRRRGSTTP